MVKYKDLVEYQNYAVLHIRRTDYLTEVRDELGGENIALPLKYYDLFIEKNCTLKKVYIIGDDIDFLREKYPENDKFIYDKNDPIIDFQLMLYAKTICISNSTFAWWGAYLNERNDVKVFAPKYWFGFKVKKEYPEGIIPAHWEQIEF